MNMIQCIRIGAEQAVAAEPHPLIKRAIPPPCNCCGADAPLASRDTRRGYYTIACENEDCPLPLCVEGETLAEVWDNWNKRIAA